MLRSLRTDTYHELLTCSWLSFVLILFSSFLVINVLFCLIFLLCEGSYVCPPHLEAYPRFISGLFLSIQTMSTIGYGGMLPTSLAGELTAALESLVGLMFTALSTGLIFARLSLPSAKIVFAKPFVYTESDQGPVLVFRVANSRGNDLISAEATLHVIDLSQRSSRLKLVSIKELTLRRSSTPTFYLNWTLIHDLDEDSPLSAYQPEALCEPHMVYILNIRGFDSSFGQTVCQYQRYRGTELRLGMYFKDMVTVNEQTGQGELQLALLDELEEAPASVKSPASSSGLKRTALSCWITAGLLSAALSSARAEAAPPAVEVPMKTELISAPLVKKVSYNKAGRPIGSSFYLRLSRADLYIKLCESKVSVADLERLLKRDSKPQRPEQPPAPREPSLELPVSVKVEVSFHQGALDLCPGDPPYIQSRIGEYVVIHSLR